MEENKFNLEEYGNSTSVTSNTRRKVVGIKKQKKSLKCKKNTYASEHSSSLKKHIVNHLEKAYACDVCEAKFAIPSHLKRHQMVHSGVRPHECIICEARFTITSHLKRHMLVHTGERPYICDVCGASFTQSGILKTHYLIHTGEKPYPCAVCKEAFTTLSNLKTHHLIHTGVKPHKCNFCGESFSRRDYLRKHVLTHIDVLPYEETSTRRGYRKSQKLAQRKNIKVTIRKITRRKSVSRRHKPYTEEVLDIAEDNINNQEFVDIT